MVVWWGVEEIFKKKLLKLVKQFDPEMAAYSNGKYVAIFAEMDDGDLFMVSGWTGHPTKSHVEIADALYAV